jgi:hypothetical protein
VAVRLRCGAFRSTRWGKRRRGAARASRRTRPDGLGAAEPVHDAASQDLQALAQLDERVCAIVAVMRARLRCYVCSPSKLAWWTSSSHSPTPNLRPSQHRLAELLTDCNAPEPVPEWLTVAEAGSLGRVTAKTVYRWRFEGKLTADGSTGRALIDRAQVGGAAGRRSEVACVDGWAQPTGAVGWLCQNGAGTVTRTCA